MSLILYGVPRSPFYRKAEMVLREKGVEQYPEAQASLDLTPDTFLKWRDQYLTPPG